MVHKVKFKEKRKEKKAQPRVQFYVLKRCRPTKRTVTCYLCLNWKLFVIENQGSDLQNRRTEIQTQIETQTHI